MNDWCGCKLNAAGDVCLVCSKHVSFILKVTKLPSQDDIDALRRQGFEFSSGGSKSKPLPEDEFWKLINKMLTERQKK